MVQQRIAFAANQYGPRILTNFMSDRGNQVTLGTFIGTFAYCMVVLRTVQGEGDGYARFVPHLSVTVALALTLAIGYRRSSNVVAPTLTVAPSGIGVGRAVSCRSRRPAGLRAARTPWRRPA